MLILYLNGATPLSLNDYSTAGYQKSVLAIDKNKGLVFSLVNGTLHKRRFCNDLVTVHINYFIGNTELLHGFHLEKDIYQQAHFMLKGHAIGDSIFGKHQ